MKNDLKIAKLIDSNREQAKLIEEQFGRIKTLARLDREAATYVESVICMRTGFTGKPPYLGWKGLGLALNEALDDRDKLKLQYEDILQHMYSTSQAK
jgi:hypothetical protein